MDYRNYLPVSVLSRKSKSSIPERAQLQNQPPQGCSTKPSGKPESPDETNRTPQKYNVESTELHRSFWILVIAIFYAMLALSSWIILCILSFRPLTTTSYEGIPIWEYGSMYWTHAQHPDFQTNEKWYRAARVIQSITGVLTIPLTSAVCSNAAVAFIQRYGKSSNMTIRKLLALADKGWTSTDLYWQLIKAPSRCWKRYFTSFLLLAIALHILGALVSPLQTLLLSSNTIKVPFEQVNWRFGELFFGEILHNSTGLTLGKISSDALHVLRSANRDQFYPQIWQAGGFDQEIHDTGHYFQSGFSTALYELPSLKDPFTSPIPNVFHTGLYSQFALRLNTSVDAAFISPSELSENCKTDRSFRIGYNGTGWSVTVCVPVLRDENGWASPWRESRDRQDIVEELYLGFGFAAMDRPEKSQSHMLKITANTTSGWFELPNYMNSGKPGPLQNTDPKNLSSASAWQMASGTPSIYSSNMTEWVKSQRTNDNGPFAKALDDLAAPGPLLSLAYGIFGAHDSFMLTCATALNDAEFSTRTGRNNIQYCSKPPLMNLLRAFKDNGIEDKSAQAHRDVYGDYDGGSSPNPKDWNDLTHWLVCMGSPKYSMEMLQAVLQEGLALVNIAWMDGAQLNYWWNSAYVLVDSGQDTQVPAISMASIVVISVLLLIYLTTLLCVASFAAFSLRWTNSLNGFAMMRIGAAVADRVPLMVSYKEDEINTLDEIPGWIGGTKLNSHCDANATGENDHHGIAKLELGSYCRLRGKQKYTCYQEDGMIDKSTEPGGDGHGEVCKRAQTNATSSTTCRTS